MVMRRRQALKMVAASIVICEIFSTFDSFSDDKRCVYPMPSYNKTSITDFVQ